jgi:4-hydroxy-tetrahydrodipicolinate synthase
MADLSFTLRGVIVPTVTPYNADGTVDLGGIRALVDFLIGKGVSGLYPGGTTAEAPLLTLDERRAIVETMIDQARGRVPVIVQVGALTTDATVALAHHAREAGADAVAAVTPWYYVLTEAAFLEYYRHVAEAVEGYPLFLYNIPGNTGNNLAPAIVAEIARRHPNVIGIKDSSGNLAGTIEMLRLRDGAFQVINGPDGLMLPALAVGVRANVSGNANVLPELFVDLHAAFNRGDLEAARTAQGRIDLARRILKDGAHLALFKAMAARRGVPVGGARGPLLAATASEVDAAAQALAEAGISLS